MAKQRPQKKTSSPSIPLAQPDRSGPDPSRQTLLDLAAERGLLDPKNLKLKNGKTAANAVPTNSEDPPVGRLGDAVLWSISLAMLHFTFDVLAQHQYAEEISWPSITTRALQALGVILILFYALHPHPTPSSFLPRISPLLHQLIFLASSVAAGCYMIYITNEYSYYAVLKRAPPLGVIWIWSVIELNLVCAVESLLTCVAFSIWGGYSFM